MSHPSRRRFLGALAGAGTVAPLSGCTVLAGALDSDMESLEDIDELPMFKGAPAQDAFPAETETIEHHMPDGMMEMEAVSIATTAATDGSNNYHFMPHVAWIEPGQTVAWEHFSRPGVSERRTHTITSFGADGKYMRLIPPDAEPFDSGYRAGTHGVDHREHLDERFNREMVDQIGQEGMFTHQFEQEGVYLFYCQPHHEYQMAAAVVVGELWGEHGDEAVDDPAGWAPAMTADTERIRTMDPRHGHAVSEQVHELRELIRSGGDMMGNGGGH